MLIYSISVRLTWHAGQLTLQDLTVSVIRKHFYDGISQLSNNVLNTSDEMNQSLIMTT